MGKFINKSESPSSHGDHFSMIRHSLGVRTRAQTLAFQRLHNSSAAGSAIPPASGAAYLQLRSRRLLRVNTEPMRRKQSRAASPNPNPSLIVPPDSPPALAGEAEENDNESEDDEIEASTGESVLEFEGGGSSTRENTASSRSNSDSSSDDSEVILAPRPPTAKEIDDFLTAAENELNDDFIAKYNFDPVNEMPLPGRYEWVKVNP